MKGTGGQKENSSSCVRFLSNWKWIQGECKELTVRCDREEQSSLCEFGKMTIQDSLEGQKAGLIRLKIEQDKDNRHEKRDGSDKIGEGAEQEISESCHLHKCVRLAPAACSPSCPYLSVPSDIQIHQRNLTPYAFVLYLDLQKNAHRFICFSSLIHSLLSTCLVEPAPSTLPLSGCLWHVATVSLGSTSFPCLSPMSPPLLWLDWITIS